MSTSWQVRAAALVVGLDLLVGAALLLLAARVARSDPGFLFAVMPVVLGAMLTAGVVVSVASLRFAVGLLRAEPGMRLRTALLGGVILAAGLLVMAVSPAVGMIGVVQGGALLMLMLSSGAERDLGGWGVGRKPPAPWGRIPGTGPWSPAPAEQGPWSPDPVSVPWIGWQGHSGPRPPWWETWRTALAQGIPLWEALVLGLALLATAAGILLILLSLGHAVRALPVVLLACAIGLTWFVERRMRGRLSRGG